MGSFSVFHWIILIGAVWALFEIFGVVKLATAKPVICKGCGESGGNVKMRTPGSTLIELVLWICLVVPGLVYSIWRHSKRHRVCPRCGSADVIPVDSPIGRKLAAQVRAPDAP